MNRSDNQDDAVVGGVNETTSITHPRLIHILYIGVYMRTRLRFNNNIRLHISITSSKTH